MFPNVIPYDPHITYPYTYAYVSLPMVMHILSLFVRAPIFHCRVLFENTLHLSIRGAIRSAMLRTRSSQLRLCHHSHGSPPDVAQMFRLRLPVQRGQYERGGDLPGNNYENVMKLCQEVNVPVNAVDLR